jgi:hypothetical protein
MNRPLSVWQALDGMGKQTGNPDQYNFTIGGYTLFVVFDHTSGLAAQVSVYITNEDEKLPLSDAQLIAASIGLANPRKDEYGDYDWGKSGDPVLATYIANDGSLVMELAGFAPLHI